MFYHIYIYIRGGSKVGHPLLILVGCTLFPLLPNNTLFNVKNTRLQNTQSKYVALDSPSLSLSLTTIPPPHSLTPTTDLPLAIFFLAQLWNPLRFPLPCDLGLAMATCSFLHFLSPLFESKSPNFFNAVWSGYFKICLMKMIDGVHLDWINLINSSLAPLDIWRHSDAIQ